MHHWFLLAYYHKCGFLNVPHKFDQFTLYGNVTENATAAGTCNGNKEMQRKNIVFRCSVFADVSGFVS